MAFPTRLGQIAHLATQAWYLARNCWDHPVLADNRVWYQGRSASLYTLVRGGGGSGPIRLRLRLDDLDARNRQDLEIIYTLRIARPGDFTRTRFDLLDLKTFEGYEIKPDNVREIRNGRRDLDDRLRMLNADSRAPIPPGIRQQVRLEGWKPKTWRAGRRWPVRGVEVPLGLKTVARVRLVSGNPGGVLAWRRLKPRRRRPRQQRLTSVRQLRAYIARTLQTAPEVSTARLLVGLGEAVGAYALGRGILSRAAVATDSAVVEAEQDAARAILRQRAASIRRVAGPGTRPPIVPSPWQPPPGTGGPQLPGGAARSLVAPMGGAIGGIAEALRQLAGELGDNELLEDLATIGEALERFYDLETVALDLLLFPVTGIEENTALGFLHPEAFFQATRNLLVTERGVTPPTPPGDRTPRAGRSDASTRGAPVTDPRRRSSGYPESGGTPPTQEELQLERDVQRMREVAELVVALAPYGAPLNTDPFAFQAGIWARLLGSLVEALGSADAVLELFGLSAVDLNDPAGQALLAEAIARDPAAMTGWAVLDWLLFEDDYVFDDMLASTAGQDFGSEPADEDE